MQIDETLPTFIKAYIKACGDYTVPPVFHYWTALSLLGAFASRDYYFEHIPGKPLHPNLYIFLVAKSGKGKGLAISSALELVLPDLVQWGKPTDKAIDPTKPYMFEGRTSAQALVSRMARVGNRMKRVHGINKVEFYYIAPEIGQSLDLPATGVSGFVKNMTGMYDSVGRPYGDNTHARGFIQVPPPYINWLAGTTPEWLKASIEGSDFSGGFSGRIINVWVDEKVDYIYKPIMLPNRPQLLAYCKAHLQAIRCGAGPFTLDADAEELDDNFCRQRYENPHEDPRVEPFYDRGGTLAKKLAMLLSLARGFDRRITAPDIVGAQRAIFEVEKDLPKIMDIVSETQGTKGVEVMRKLVEGNRRIARQRVMKHLRVHAGVTRTGYIEVEQTLLAEKTVAIDRARDELIWIPKTLIHGRKPEGDFDDADA